MASLRGMDAAKEVNQRSNSTYNQSTKGKFTYQHWESNNLNKTHNNWILSNKFEYGYDPNGGRKLASTTT